MGLLVLFSFLRPTGVVHPASNKFTAHLSSLVVISLSPPHNFTISGRDGFFNAAPSYVCTFVLIVEFSSCYYFLTQTHCSSLLQQNCMTCS